jgi:hypothetical protein
MNRSTLIACLLGLAFASGPSLVSAQGGGGGFGTGMGTGPIVGPGSRTGTGGGIGAGPVVGPGSGTGTGGGFGTGPLVEERAVVRRVPSRARVIRRCLSVPVKVCRPGFRDGSGPRCRIVRQKRCR